VQDYFCSNNPSIKAPTVDGNEYNKGTKTFSHPEQWQLYPMKLLGFADDFFQL
jgi:hypothetical protein